MAQSSETNSSHPKIEPGAGEIFHIAVMPPVMASEEIVSKIAGLTSQPVYKVRPTLAGSIPKILANYKDYPTADEARKNIVELGVAAFIITESSLRLPRIPLLTASSITIQGPAITFTNRSGESKSINSRDVFLILIGDRNSVLIEERRAPSSIKLNLPATLLTGGVPIMRRVEGGKKEAEKIKETFIRLYGPTSDTPLVEIRHLDFDYSFLGDNKELTASANIASLIQVFKRSFPLAIFDDRMTGRLSPRSSGSLGNDTVERDCVMIVRYHQLFA